MAVIEILLRMASSDIEWLVGQFASPDRNFKQAISPLVR